MLLGERSDDSGAVVVGGRTLSRHELIGWATAVADEIQGARVVAVHATPTVETVVGVLAGLLCGVPVVPLPPDSGPAELAHLLRDSGAELVLAEEPELLDALPAGAPRPAVLPIGRTRRSNTHYPEPPSGRPALILYTSGTTGPPKGALISRAAIAADLDALADAWQWTPDDTLVHGLPLFHVHGLVLGVLGPLRVGSRLIHTGRPTPQAYAAAGGTLYFGVPTVWSRIGADSSAARALRSARLLVSGSAALPVPVFHRLAELVGQAPLERYGMTETLITVSGRADGERRPGHVGLPVAGVRTRLVDEHGEIVPADGESIGELQVSGATLFDGYLGRGGAGDGRASRETSGGTSRETSLAASGETDADGWFATGDVAVIGPDGWHRIVGRASTDLIKSGGYRIGAGEVEDALLAHPSVAEAAVVGTPHDDLGEQVTAYVVADGVSGQQLIDFVAERLSVHKRPRQVHLVDRLPRNAMGKVAKKLLTPG
ncbi:fatty acid CoA ligase FadD36 [Micromonospora pisi]|uniref:Fatty acid CoA ligase FadD36 n=1 Tax=Micromonospora pisi TaxID=589240 RepID=A0A495JTB3_9ACTN|nr:acyl-CoA synthetase [Micromonospora pisi]RKR92247.1 fatty acid CoA ligase FadD36 [Micromonospora pisi]